MEDKPKLDTEPIRSDSINESFVGNHNRFKPLWKAVVVSLAIMGVWYGLEFQQYGTLQWDKCES